MIRTAALRCVLALGLALPAAAPAQEQAQRGSGHPAEQLPERAVRVPEGVVVPDWEALTETQRRYLRRHEAEWDKLPASRRVLAMERAERRMRWDAMSPAQREKIRKGMRHYRELTPGQREQLRKAFRSMRALPEAERRTLMEQWRSLDPEQRRAWLDAGGPGISPPPARAD